MSAGEFARCPNGHHSVILSSGIDSKGHFVAARCVTPDCGASATYRVEKPIETESLADRAAKYAHDHKVTRLTAARLFGVRLNSVVDAWDVIYPNEPRTLT